MNEARGRLTARRTGVLALVALSALVAALVLRDGPSGEPTSSRTTVPDVEQDDAAVSVGLERLTSIEQPLSVWMRIADCESGEWDADADPIPGSARWSYGSEADQHLFEGGLHFEPSTWEDFRDPGMPPHAGEATPVAQLVVAERVLEQQGWEAWPVCSRKLGLR